MQSIRLASFATLVLLPAITVAQHSGGLTKQEVGGRIEVRASQPKRGSVQVQDWYIGKPPWDWTVEERLAARFDPQNLKDRKAADGHRVQVFHGSETAAMGDASSKQEQIDIIVGSRNPELFMPWELFDTLAANAFGDPADFTPFRFVYSQNAAARGVQIPGDFWQKLEEASKPYLDARSRFTLALREKRNATDQQEIVELKTSLCGLRAQALDRAQQVLGPAFLQVLYSAVAPDEFVAGNDSPAQHRRIQAGCK